MIYALLLIASLANAQEVSTGAATSLLDEVRISNLGKDTRDLLSGRYRQTGKPTFANGFCFADGTCQTTAPGSSVFRQSVSSMTTARFLLGPAIPADDSIPQISEGGQVLVATMTPVNSASDIRISGVVNLGETTNNCDNAAMCLFKDANADAAACWSFNASGSPAFAAVPFFYKEAAANTTLRNYSIRAGCGSANTISVNEQTGADVYGLKLTSYLEIQEITP